MFRRKDNDQSTVSLFVEKKTRMFKSKIDFVLKGQHRHYFSKREAKDPNIDPACKICGMLLSDFKVEKKFEALNKEIMERNRK